MLILGVFVFFGAALVDFADVSNQQAVQENQAHRAARYSVGMYLIGMAGFLSVLEISPYFIIPEALGLYMGSIIAVRRRKPKDKLTKTIAIVVKTGRPSTSDYLQTCSDEAIRLPPRQL